MKTIRVQLILPAVCIVMASCGGSETKEDPNQPEVENVEKTEVEELDYSDMSMCDFRIDNVGLNYKMMLPIKTIGERPQIEHPQEVTWHVKLNDKFHLTIEDWGKKEQSMDTIKEKITQDYGVFDVIVHNEDDDEIVYLLKGKGDADIGGFNHFCLIKEFEGSYFTIESHYLGMFTRARVNDMLKAAKSFQVSVDEF